MIQKAIGGIENALLDLKGKALGVPVYELFGGPTRDDVDVYWSHCGTTRARAWQVTNTDEARVVRRRDEARRAKWSRVAFPPSRRTSSFPARSRRC